MKAYMCVFCVGGQDTYMLPVMFNWLIYMVCMDKKIVLKADTWTTTQVL